MDLEWELVLLQIPLEGENRVEYRAEYQLARRLEKEGKEVGGAEWVLDLWILLQYPLS